MMDIDSAIADRNWGEVVAHVRSLAARCEALEKDAARYRWLRHVVERDDADGVVASVHISTEDDGVVYEDGFGEDFMDSAIDACLSVADGGSQR